MWLHERVFYEIYVPSFADGDHNGIGDFTGIIDKLDYLQQLGVKAIWLTPFYQSPKIDNGYDISDYYSVDPCYGTMEQMEEFLKKVREKDIKVVIDLVLNHTSNLHPWFLEAQKSIDNPYRDFYIWEEKIPNNWESFFGGSAWEYSSSTKQYYYHAFSKEQVCLNWSNDNVMKEMKKVIKFWLDLGVDGFRLDVINFLKVDYESFYKNNPYDDAGKQIHQFDQNQPGVIDIIKDLVVYIKSWDDKVLIGEVGSEDMEVLCNYVGNGLLDVVFNFNLGSINKLNVNYIVEQLIHMEAKQILPTLFFGSHDMGRWFSRLCNENINQANVLAALTIFGYGVPFIYQGDELGLSDFLAKNEDELIDIQGKLAFKKCIVDGDTKEEALRKANAVSRDKSRKLISWKDEWLNTDVSNGNDSAMKKGIFEFYKSIIDLRNNYKILQYGNYKSIDFINNTIILIRIYKNQKATILLNFSDNVVLYDKPKGQLLFSNKEQCLSKIKEYEVTVILE